MRNAFLWCLYGIVELPQPETLPEACRDRAAGTREAPVLTRIQGAGTKGGVQISLDAHTRRVVEAALTQGHLCDLEAAYRTQNILDYPLIPGGPMVEGRVPLGDAAQQPASPSTCRRWYRQWEREAGVARLPGRGWQALRRAATDLASTFHSDPDVLDRLGGWVPGSGVRARVYRDHADARVGAEAERVRARLRASLRSPTRPAAASGGEAVMAGPSPNSDYISSGH